MARRVMTFCLTYFYWLVFFILTRLLFVVYNWAEAAPLSWMDRIAIFTHGLILDLSAAGYLMLLPGLLVIVSGFMRRQFYPVFLRIYSLIGLIGMGLAAVADMVLYGYWGFRLDITPLLYLKTPGEALASIAWWEVALPLAIGVALVAGFDWLLRRVVLPFTRGWMVSYFRVPIVFLVLTLALLLPIRGGLGVAPNNLGRVYFHENAFANHAAINLPWNIVYSLTKQQAMHRSYHFMDTDKAQAIVEALYPAEGAPEPVLKTTRPNILIIILESFASQVVAAVGGEANVTPQFNQLASQGILFTNFYASGDRTDKSIVPILSGYPSLPQSQIIKYPRKVQHLPMLYQDLNAVGYRTGFYYGGEIDFANLKAYLVINRVDTIVSMADFPSTTYNAKWGVHDHIMFERLLEDLEKTPQPFGYVFLTLSSHEPFDVPGCREFIGTTRADKYRNAVFYADSCLGEFIRRAQKSTWWSKTLIVLVPDHGVRFIGHLPNHAIAKFQIPMLWLGGALQKRGIRIAKYAAQNDLPVTLLRQLQISNPAYRFGKDILDPRSRSFAFYTFNNGFGLLNETTKLVYNNTTGQYIITEGLGPTLPAEAGTALLQVLSADFSRR